MYVRELSSWNSVRVLFMDGEKEDEQEEKMKLEEEQKFKDILETQ